MKKIENFIDGEYKSISNNSSPIYNPSTGEKIGDVVLSNIDDFKQAINSSKAAQKIWQEYTPLKRSRIISKFKNLMRFFDLTPSKAWKPGLHLKFPIFTLE